jgi:DNA-binding SARP family transcriptional activator
LTAELLNVSERGARTLALRLLGPIGVSTGTAPRTVGSARLRSLLAALAVNANDVVPLAELTDWIWGPDETPGNVAGTVHTCTCRLRQLLRPCTELWLCTAPRGYRLAADPEIIDALRFERVLDQARAARREGRLQAAAGCYEDALGLWCGPALADVAPTRSVSAETARLNELRLAAQVECLQVELQLGHATSILADLAKLATEHPHHEELSRLYMVALDRSGRGGEAMNVYQKLYKCLRDDLGTQPGRVSRDLYSDLLRETSHETGCEPGGETAPAGPVRARAVRARYDLPVFPNQTLPRARELERVALATAAGTTGCPSLAVITGPPGAGKTTIAVQYAWRHREAYPDGACFLPMSDADGRPVPTAGLMSAALNMLGVTAGATDSAESARAAYQDALARRRALIVLDGVVSSDQVTPLLSGDETCFLITSSRQLHDLCGPSRLVHIGALSAAESGQMLSGLLAADTVRPLPDDVAELCELCEGLPIALHIVAAHVATGYYSDIRVGIAALRADPPERLAELSYGRLSVRASYARALATCDASERRVLGLLASCLRSGATARAMEEMVAASLPGGALTARRAIRGLIQANLLQLTGMSASRPEFGLSALCQGFAVTAIDVPELARTA